MTIQNFIDEHEAIFPLDSRLSASQKAEARENNRKQYTVVYNVLTKYAKIEIEAGEFAKPTPPQGGAKPHSGTSLKIE